MNHEKPIKVLIVDDSAFIREMFFQILSEDDEIEVIGEASDPYDARQKIKDLNPDVMTLDIEMPHMDGISFLEKVMHLRPMPVVMVSTLTQKGADATMRCLELGAVDTIAKPTNQQNRAAILTLKEELTEKVKVAAKANIRGFQKEKITGLQGSAQLKASDKIIAIGASTGGVEAIREVLQPLPAEMPPILITQHMPVGFTASFAKRLDTICTLHVCEAEHNQPIKPGYVYIAPGSAHLRLMKSAAGYVCKVGGTEKVSGHCPSVDVLFDSFASVAGKKAIGVILTGMGKDGAIGLKHMRDAGAYTIGQDERSSVVYGMPRAANLNQAVVKELSLPAIAEEILRQSSSATAKEGRVS